MTEELRNNIINKIMKLLELGNAEKNSDIHEQQAASDMASRLMAEYSIDFAHLRNVNKDTDSFVQMTVDGSDTNKVDFEATLAYMIAKAFDCKVINTTSKTLFPEAGQRPYGSWQMCFVGTKNDLEIAVFFFKYLRRTVYSLAQKNVTADNVRPTYTSSGKRKVDLKNAKRNHCYGLVTTIGERLVDLYQRREQFIPSDCKALMVVKKDGLVKAFKEMFPNAVTRRTSSLKGDVGAYHNGKSDGLRVNLSRPISNNGAAAAAQIGG